MQTNLFYAAASAVMAATAAIHVFAGGPEIHQPILDSALPDVVRSVGSVIWHAITWVLVLMTLALASLAQRPNAQLEAMVAAIQIGFAVLFIGYGLARLGSVWEMPQWIIFSAIPALMLLGRLHRSRAAQATG
ncbi:hypothetical protein ACUXV3_11710 [Roseobacteraceae bacterium NS-SX3]